jgi:hypothetical protein
MIRLGGPRTGEFRPLDGGPSGAATGAADPPRGGGYATDEPLATAAMEMVKMMIRRRREPE